MGEQYTGEAITRRILENSYPKLIRYEKTKPSVKKYTFKGNFQKAHKLTGWRALYFHFLYRMGVLPKNKPRPPSHPILWEDVRQLRKYTTQIRLLSIHRIDTSEQLQAFVDTSRNRMEDLIRQRTHIQNKLRRAKEPEVIEMLKAEKTTLTGYITPLRRDLAVAAEIEERTARMKEKLAIIRQLELQGKTKQRGIRTYART